MDTDYINDYISSINKALGVYVSVSVEEAVLKRYALYGYCIGNKVLCWSELFEQLDEYTKKLHIIHAYSFCWMLILLDAELSIPTILHQYSFC